MRGWIRSRTHAIPQCRIPGAAVCDPGHTQPEGGATGSDPHLHVMKEVRSKPHLEPVRRLANSSRQSSSKSCSTTQEHAVVPAVKPAPGDPCDAVAGASSAVFDWSEAAWAGSATSSTTAHGKELSVVVLFYRAGVQGRSRLSPSVADSAGGIRRT